MEKFRVFASCHNHSTFSDGEYTPQMLVRVAKCMGHGGIILADHDTVAGYPFIKEAAEKAGLLTMLGCEFSTYHRAKDGSLLDIHLLGYDFDPNNEKIKEIIAYGSSVQTERTHTMFEWGLERGTLRKGCTWEDVLSDHPYHNYICNNEVFASFLKRDIYKYNEYELVRKANFSYALGLEEKIFEVTGKSYKNIHTADVIKAILNAGGVPVIAHPHNLMRYAEEFYELGALGFETRTSEMTEQEHEFFESFCKERSLYRLGGADHENVLGGLLSFGDSYASKYELSGVPEERFTELYNRQLG